VSRANSSTNIVGSFAVFGLAWINCHKLLSDSGNKARAISGRLSGA